LDVEHRSETQTVEHPASRTRPEGGGVTTVLATSNALTAADRCDRCGAQAYIRVVFASGGELLFCGHHGRKYDGHLRVMAVEYHDETARLEATPTVASDDER